MEAQKKAYKQISEKKIIDSYLKKALIHRAVQKYCWLNKMPYFRENNKVAKPRFQSTLVKGLMSCWKWCIDITCMEKLLYEKAFTSCNNVLYYWFETSANLFLNVFCKEDCVKIRIRLRRKQIIARDKPKQNLNPMLKNKSVMEG